MFKVKAFCEGTLLKTLKVYNWLACLPKTIQDEVSNCMTERTLSDGEALFHIGDESNDLYEIVTGRIKCNMYSYEGKEVVGSKIAGELKLVQFVDGKSTTKTIEKIQACES